MSGSNIVAEWLRSLHLGQYAESFLDNGYDDLEICKQVGDPDLDAIGVFNPSHRSRLLQSVRTLREEGAASVYFTLEESQAIQEECKCETSSARSSRSGGKNSDKDSGRSPSSNGSAHELPRYLDEYEEGKAELVRIPRLQLKILLREKLIQDGIRLSNHPYSTSTGERGYLEGLGSRYAELFNTHYSDVLGHLEELRQREWAELSPRFRVLSNTTGAATTAVLQNGAPPQHLPTQTGGAVPGTPGPPGGTLARHNGLVTSLSQPIYVPGKYSPSSCLSDREEDEIYGFAGYNVYGGGSKAHPPPQQQQQHVAAATSAVRPHPRQPQLINKHNFHNWLSPRSAYFYELPPSERPTKKRTSLTRLLRHLKTHRKDKSSNSRNNHRVCSPDEPAMSAPLTADYDKMRLLHKVGRATTFEETIHRLKVQEALKKKERIDREHEETRPGGMSVTQILRDIRAGVLVGSSHISSPGGGGASSRQAASSAASHPDDTYMYDDEMSRLGQQHWYDEPPYESDPEDFLMQADPSPPAAVTLHNSRLCFTMRGGGEECFGSGGVARGSEVSEVISLRSAGDISLPSQQRALLVPCHTARSNRNNRESGDYAASDVNSICSRLSSLSMETSRSEHLEMDVYHRLRPYNGGEPAISPGHSSDYAEHDELVSLQPRCGEVVSSSRSRKCGDSSSSSSKSLGRRHHHHHHHHHHHVHHRQPRPHHSSAESLPSASSTQALVSNMEEYSPQGGGPLVPLARALVDAQPNHYDPDALRFKKGDIIEVLKMSKSGVWRGRVHGRTGHFKFINVELLSSGMPNIQSNEPHHPQSKPHRITNRPLTLEEMLTAIHMEEHMSLFVLNGYEDLESFCEIREEDLDYLGLTDPEHRAKILAAVQVLQEFEKTEEEWNKNDPGHLLSKEAANNLSQLNIQPQSGIEQSLADSSSFLPNIPISASSDPPPLPAPSGPVQPPACVLTPQTPQSGSGGGKGGSSDSGVSSSSAGSSVRGGGSGGGRPRPPPPPKPGSITTPDSPSYVNHVVIEAANGTNNTSITNESPH
ncbi:shal K[+] channel interacting protein isoform X1 [Rhodnius prolixus]|uniref:shal K[+] channel interacting protein isoform X1 n=2 Tax=Rhodnius prolixus TaxID=13249 RepID=UPI003D187C0B